MTEWNIQSRAHACAACGKAFVDKEVYHTLLFDDKAELPEGTQVVVVPVVRNQAPPTNLPIPKSRPPGAPPESLLRMAGSIPIADCVEMEQAIEEGCGQVNANAW